MSNSTKNPGAVTICWACAEELPRGAQKCSSCGEPQSICWACAEVLPRGAQECPSCSEPQGTGTPAQSSDRPESRLSMIYLVGLPILCMCLGHRLGFGMGLGGVVGLGGWMLAHLVSSSTRSA